MRLLKFLVSGSLMITFMGCSSGQSEDGARNEADSAVTQQADSMATDNGLVTLRSQNSVEETYQNLKEAINGNDALSIIAELNHRKNAASVDLQLRPTRILMFGNPRLGTPLMQASPTTGIDLPQKFLVYEDSTGQTFIAYNDPAYLAERHDIEDRGDVLDTISKALQNLANAATTLDDN